LGWGTAKPISGASNYANGGLWDIGMYNKRVETMYNDNGTINQAVTIESFS
jgi:hypothetical protein